MLTDPYRTLHTDLLRHFPHERLIRDPLRTLAYGSDASFYRLTPHLVVQTRSEADIIALLRSCRDHRVPLTFRAAGTSLSGQAISDSVLATLAGGWTGIEVLDGGERIRLQPGVVGAAANAVLASLGRKIGPDPASINSAMIGGIAANNASGMCCGTAQNSYRTLVSMRLILADGTLVDTGDAASRASFARSHGALLERLGEIARRVRNDLPLASRIREKYRMKNTTGYGLNALVDFDDPLDILQHLMIGSEGTLGFIAEITLRTVPELPAKASSLLLFPDLRAACEAVPLLRANPVEAVELMDRASLRSVEAKHGMPEGLAALGPGVTALLIETRAADPGPLRLHTEAISRALESVRLERPLTFTDRPADAATLWNVRKGLFPSVGAMRQVGTTVIIEDVAFPVPRLGEAATELQGLFRTHGYDGAIIFGHALEGNLHFVFTQDFNRAPEVDRYRRFIDDVTRMVVDGYDGSLKAEHGTGRNMAPFVEREWGAQATALMRELKRLLDPDALLNPGVILNDDREAHLKNLKPLPATDPLVDTCIECGFCEVRCPSRNLTLTPRQRIVVQREISRLRSSGEDPVRMRQLQEGFVYAGEQTCATDGLCAIACPVGIDTGKLVKHLRHDAASPAAVTLAGFLAGHMTGVTAAMRCALRGVHAAHRMLGTRHMTALTSALRRASAGRIPLWTPEMPRAASRVTLPHSLSAHRPAVVYFPTCINRTMGTPSRGRGERQLTAVVLDLLEKGGYRAILPPDVNALCCGMAFASKGFTEAGDAKARELEEALLAASENGRFPVVTDMSPCLFRMREVFRSPLRLYEPVRFAHELLVDRLEFHPRATAVAVHTTCSAEKMELGEELRSLAGLCAKEVIVPEGIGCCGWAGDRGFTFPELNASALARLHDALPSRCAEGYSTSRTCEIGLSLHAGIPYRSILHLVDECTTPKTSVRSG